MHTCMDAWQSLASITQHCAARAWPRQIAAAAGRRAAAAARRAGLAALKLSSADGRLLRPGAVVKHRASVLRGGVGICVGAETGR